MSLARVRRAAVPDAAAIATLQVAAWKRAYRGILPDALLDGLSLDDYTARRHGNLEQPTPGVLNWVAELAGAVVGWGATGVPHEGDLPAGTLELYALYVHPDHAGQGHGRTLMRHALAFATEQGAPCMTLWVLAGNAHARRFYRGAGFVLDSSAEPQEFKDTGALKVRMRVPLGQP